MIYNILIQYTIILLYSCLLVPSPVNLLGNFHWNFDNKNKIDITSKIFKKLDIIHHLLVSVLTTVDSDTCCTYYKFQDVCQEEMRKRKLCQSSVLVEHTPTHTHTCMHTIHMCVYKVMRATEHISIRTYFLQLEKSNPANGSSCQLRFKGIWRVCKRLWEILFLEMSPYPLMGPLDQEWFKFRWFSPPRIIVRLVHMVGCSKSSLHCSAPRKRPLFCLRALHSVVH